jgi:hypothetical protein
MTSMQSANAPWATTAPRRHDHVMRPDPAARRLDEVIAPVSYVASVKDEGTVAGQCAGKLGYEVRRLELGLIRQPQCRFDGIRKIDLFEELHRKADALGSGALPLQLARAVGGRSVDVAIRRLEITCELIPPHEIFDQTNTSFVRSGIRASASEP